MDLSRGIGAEISAMLDEAMKVVEEGHVIEEQRRQFELARRQHREAVERYMNLPSYYVNRLRAYDSLPIVDLTYEEVEMTKVKDYSLELSEDDKKRGFDDLCLRTAVLDGDYHLSLIAKASNGASVVRSLCVIKVNRSFFSDGIMVDDGESSGLRVPAEGERQQIRSIILEACRLAGFVDPNFLDEDPRDPATY